MAVSNSVSGQAGSLDEKGPIRSLSAGFVVVEDRLGEAILLVLSVIGLLILFGIITSILGDNLLVSLRPIRAVGLYGIRDLFGHTVLQIKKVRLLTGIMAQ